MTEEKDIFRRVYFDLTNAQKSDIIKAQNEVYIRGEDVGQIYEFEKEKLIVGVIYNDMAVYEKALEMLKAAFGEIDGESERFSFSEEFSNYYDEELGGEGLRVIFSFKDTVDASRQAEIKA